MKKNIVYALIAFLSFTFAGQSGKATLMSVKTETSNEVPKGTTTNLEEVTEKKDGEKETAKPADKRALKKEIRKANKIQQNGSGVYVSLGALIIIILLLIILL